MATVQPLELVLKLDNEVMGHSEVTHPLAKQFTEDTRRLRRHMKRNSEIDIRRAWQAILKDHNSNASKAIRGEYYQIYEIPWPLKQLRGESIWHSTSTK